MKPEAVANEVLPVMPVQMSRLPEMILSVESTSQQLCGSIREQ
jgi:hypothetical protein